ncbi:hypothetical protein [Nocardia brasiliensis]|uniref:hypothetical protein n=1 Tax=Nocardia brasiliensis TaxID=37326 RepID=UPI00245430CD|nr:hypothetical protein [Nocardia brasiliensis]
MLVVGFWSRRVTGADSRGIALRIMAGVQVNTTYFAIPVFVLLFGDAAPIFPIILLQVCVLTVVVIAVMEFGAGQEDPGGQRPIAAAVRGIRAAWLTYSVLIAAMPSPQNLFIFAQRYETDIDLAASIVAKTSLVALLLLPGWLLLAR